MIFARKSQLYCSFCRKPDKEVAKLIAGPGVYICDACVSLCNDILDGKDVASFAGWESLTDRQLLGALSPSEASVQASRRVLATQVGILRSRGASWETIGKALGVSRQAAWERFS